MDPQTWQLAKTLFLDTVDAEPTHRAQILADTDPELRRMVEDMLCADADLGDAAPRPAVADLDRLETIADRRLEDSWFGHYQIRRLLGRGGMGVVYLAERHQDDVIQNVALKLIQNTRLSPDSMRRFLAERRLLARLDHPGIARLIDLGQIDDTPYYAMEYVDGEPLLDYCDRHRLDLGARIRLLLDVCAAVAHAHRSLVVHRDVKPSNVLVDRDGRPRLLDFGIAKALDAAAGETGAETVTHNRFLSPQCTAPEALTDAPLTTACDVYALGALLYQLLCGTTALDFPSGRAAEIEATILHQQPPRPSERVQHMSRIEALERVAQRSLAGVSTWVQALNGDLDTITLRALAKEPARRYAHVEALTDDLERYLHDRPVKARPDSLGYRAGKYLRRHRWPAALVALGLAAIATVIVLLWRQSILVAAERDTALVERARAETISEFLVDTFTMADPTRALGDQITARELLDRALQRLDAGAGLGDASRLPILLTMARAYDGLGRFDDALSLARQVLAVAGPDNDRLAAHRQIANTLNAQGQFADALIHAESALDLDDGPDSWSVLAPILANLDRSDEAEALHRRTIQSLAEQPDDNGRLAVAKLQLARHLHNARRHDEARTLLLDALAWQRQALPNRHPNIAETLLALTAAERTLGNFEAAATHAKESVDILERVFGNEHPAVGRAWLSLGNALSAGGRHQEAVTAMTRALELIRHHHGEHGTLTAIAHYGLARILYSDLHQPAAAEEHFRAALAAAELGHGSQSNLAHFRLGLGTALNALNRPEEAQTILETAMRELVEHGGAETINAGLIGSEIAESLRRRSRWPEAEERIGNAIQLLVAGLGADNTSTILALARRQAIERRDRQPLEPRPESHR